jgi:DNA-binding SARP family transcriptional activator
MAPPVPAGPDQGSEGNSVQSPPGSGQPPTVPPDPGTTPPGAQPDAGAPPGSAADSPSPGNRPGSPAPAGHFGVIVAAGIALAGGVVALLVRARGKMEARQRSRYRAGSGRRDVLPTPPAVRSMTRAHHTNPHRDHLDHHTDLRRPPAPGPTTPTASHDTSPEPVSGPGPRREPLARPVWPVGMRGEQPVALDLTVGSVAFTGPGATDAIRALIVATLTGVAGDTAPGRVIMSAAETAELFGFDHAPLPEGVIVTADQAASFTVATTLITHTVGDPLDDGPVLLIINTMRGAQLDTARATLTRLTAAGIGVLILGDHPEGALCDINTDLIVTAAYGPAAEHLHGAKMFELTLEHLEGTLSPLTADPHLGTADWLQDTLSAASADSGPDAVKVALHGADFDGADLESDHSDGAADAVTEVQAAASAHDSPEFDASGSGLADEVPTSGQPRQAGSPAGWHEGLIREIGTRNNLPLTYDLGAFAGLGLTGPGAPAALRALWIRLLAPTHTDPSLTPAEVIVPIDTADALLGEPDPNPDADTDGWGPDEVALLAWPGEVDDLDAALQRLETEIITRASAHYATTDTTPPPPSLPSVSQSPPVSSPLSPPHGRVAPIVLITHSPGGFPRPQPDPALDPDPDSVSGAAVEAASMAGRWASRLGEISERGAALGIAVVVLGHWAHGTNCHLDAGGQVTAGTGPGGFILREATVHQLDTATARATLMDDPLPSPTDDTPAHPEPTSSEPTTQETDTQESPGQPSGETTLTHATDHTPQVAAVARNGDSDGAGAGLDNLGEDAPVAEPQPMSPQADPHTGATSDQAAPPAPVPASPADEVVAAPDEPAPVGSDRQPDHTGADPHGHSTGSASAEAELSVSPLVPAPVAPDTEPVPAATPCPPRAHELDSVPSEALLVVLVLGPLAVFARPAPGQPLREITGRLSPTLRLILAALAASTDPVHTETLLDMCFAGGDEALHRLQSNITRLRAALRAAIGHDAAIKLIANTAGRYHFTSACWVDHHTLHTQLRTAATTVGEPNLYATRWAAAFALYRGPLLDGLEYDVDTEWLAPHREHTLRAMIDLARQLAEHLTPTHPAQAAGYLSTALRLEPHNEDTARHLITHHLTHGHRHAAEQVLAQLTRNLTDIDATPQPRTVALLADCTRPGTTP